MDLNKVRSLSDAELEDALREAKQDLWGARFALSTRQLKDYSTIPQTRRTIARILTVQRERKLGRTAWRRSMAGKLRVTQTKSTISHIARNRATIKALGLHGIGSTSIVPDNDATRGMVRQVRFLVSVEEVAEEAPRGRGRAASDTGKSDAEAAQE